MGRRLPEGYLVLGSALLLAAPWFLGEGGYTRITAFKALSYTLLTLLFVLAGCLTRPPLRGFWRVPERSIALGYLLCCLLSALCSPWPQAAFLGDSRREGFIQLALYVLSFLLLSLRRLETKWPLLAFAAALGLNDLICCLQLGGWNPLGLYPAGLGWGDANLRYAGAYLGTVGNAGQTGAVLAAASALFFLLILRRGGRWWALLPLLLLNAGILGKMCIAAPMLALTVTALLSLPLMAGTLRTLCRWVILAALTAGALYVVFLPGAVSLALSLTAAAALALLRFAPGETPVRPAALGFFLLLLLGGLVFIFFYGGNFAPLAELSALLHGHLTEEMGSGRIGIWRKVLAIVPEHLWLGTGPDTLGLRGLEPGVWTAEEAGRTVVLSLDAAHSEYLHTLVCCGLPAALCHLALALCGAFRFIKRRSVCAGGALCYAIQALFGISMCASAPIFWVLLALSVNERDEDYGLTDK